LTLAVHGRTAVDELNWFGNLCQLRRLSRAFNQAAGDPRIGGPAATDADTVWTPPTKSGLSTLDYIKPHRPSPPDPAH